jgi:hypothetical protein
MSPAASESAPTQIAIFLSWRAALRCGFGRGRLLMKVRPFYMPQCPERL